MVEQYVMNDLKSKLAQDLIYKVCDIGNLVPLELEERAELLGMSCGVLLGCFSLIMTRKFGCSSEVADAIIVREMVGVLQQIRTSHVYAETRKILDEMLEAMK